MNFRRCIFAAFAVLVAASTTFAAVPRYVEGEAIVMMRTDEARAEVDSYAARSASNAASGSAASELGAVVVRNFLPVKAATAGSECLENDGRVGAARALSANGAERGGGETYAVAQLRSASGESTEEFIERLRGDPRVVSAMPNYIMRLSSPARIVSAEDEEIEIAEPNDPLYGEQWGLERINMPAVWAQTAEAESEEVVVAVIDTGIIYDHEDLADNMYEFDADTLSRMDVAGIGAAEFAGSHGAWFHSSAEFGENEDEAPVTSAFDPIPVGPGAGTTKLASIDDVFSVTSDSRYVGDVEGHGTHVAGIIGAVTDNETGIAGVAQNVKLMAVPVFSAFVDEDDDGSVEYATGSLTSDQMRAIDFVLAAKAAGVNVRVANMSLGSWTDADNAAENEPYSAKIKALSDAGVIVCIAAGNEDQDLDAPEGEYAGQICTPAMFRYENTITVGASGEDDERSYAAGSNFSSSGEWVDVFAPGGYIMSTCRYEPITGDGNTWSEDGYTTISGTSMASPHVAGVAALLCSLFPERGAAEIKQMILDGADGSVLREGYSQYGLIDAYEAWKIGMGAATEAEPVEPEQILVSEGAAAVKAEFASDKDALPDSLKNCVTAVDDEGLYLDHAIVGGAVESLESSREVERVSLFPVFSAQSSEEGELDAAVVSAIAFTVPGEIFGDGGGLGDVAVCKVKPDGTCLRYALDEDGAAADGEFKIYNKDWSSFGGTFDGEAHYNVVLYIADNGPYDLDSAEGTITDPTAIVRYGAQKQSVSGGSSGGCSAGFGAAALFALPALWLFGCALRKRAR